MNEKSELGYDMRIGDLIDANESFHEKSSCWGQHWVALSTFIWQIWSERNHRYKDGDLKPIKVIATLFVRDVELLFDVRRFRETYRSRLEDFAVNTWKRSSELTMGL